MFVTASVTLFSFTVRFHLLQVFFWVLKGIFPFHPVLVAGAPALCAVSMCCVYGRDRSLSSHSQNISPKSFKTNYQRDGIRVGVQVFNHCELEAATGNFDSAYELGHGGFGTVYFGKNMLKCDPLQC